MESPRHQEGRQPRTAIIVSTNSVTFITFSLLRFLCYSLKRWCHQNHELGSIPTHWCQRSGIPLSNWNQFSKSSSQPCTKRPLLCSKGPIKAPEYNLSLSTIFCQSYRIYPLSYLIPPPPTPTHPPNPPQQTTPPPPTNPPPPPHTNPQPPHTHPPTTHQLQL